MDIQFTQNTYWVKLTNGYMIGLVTFAFGTCWGGGNSRRHKTSLVVRKETIGNQRQRARLVETIVQQVLDGV